MFTKRTAWSVLLAIAAVAGGLVFSRWAALPRAPFKMEQVSSSLALIFFCSLLIERTIEVFLTIWRAETANRLERSVRGMVRSNLIGPHYQAAQDALGTYRSATQRLALKTAFGFGLVIAGLGVRVLEPFFLTPFPAEIDGLQQGFLRFADILFTAALLAGGADPIHKFLDAFRKFMEATSGKAAGTVPPSEPRPQTPVALAGQVERIIQHVSNGAGAAAVVDPAKLRNLAQGIATLDRDWLAGHAGRPVAGLRAALLTLDRGEVPQLLARIP